MVTKFFLKSHQYKRLVLKRATTEPLQKQKNNEKNNQHPQKKGSHQMQRNRNIIETRSLNAFLCVKSASLLVLQRTRMKEALSLEASSIISSHVSQTQMPNEWHTKNPTVILESPIWQTPEDQKDKGCQ